MAHKDKGLRVVGIGIQDSETNVRKFMSETGMDWPVGMDKGDSIARAYAITFGAGVVIVDESGIIRAWHGTAFGSAVFESELKLVLEGDVAKDDKRVKGGK